jgi:hypothetical protein
MTDEVWVVRRQLLTSYLNSMTVAWNILKSPAISLLENVRAERLLNWSVFESGSQSGAGFPDHNIQWAFEEHPFCTFAFDERHSLQPIYQEGSP